jgi:hypothetical protein
LRLSLAKQLRQRIGRWRQRVRRRFCRQTHPHRELEDDGPPPPQAAATYPAPLVFRRTDGSTIIYRPQVRVH